MICVLSLHLFFKCEFMVCQTSLPYDCHQITMYLGRSLQTFKSLQSVAQHVVNVVCKAATLLISWNSERTVKCIRGSLPNVSNFPLHSFWSPVSSRSPPGYASHLFFCSPPSGRMIWSGRGCTCTGRCMGIGACKPTNTSSCCSSRMGGWRLRFARFWAAPKRK